MALQTSGPITMADIASEFGGTIPHRLSEYYGAASGIPSTGTLSYSDFYGASSVLVPVLTYLGGNSSSTFSTTIPVSTSANRLVVTCEGHSSSNIGTASVSINGQPGTVFGGAGGPGWEQSAIGWRQIPVSDTSLTVAWSRSSAVSYVNRVYLLENVNSLSPYFTVTGGYTWTPIGIGDVAFVSLASDDSVAAPVVSSSGGSYTDTAGNVVVTNMRYRCGHLIVNNTTQASLGISAQDRCVAGWN